MRRATGDRGVVAVETALVIPVLLALVGGVLVFGLRMWSAATVDHAAQGGLRAAALRESVRLNVNDAPYSGKSGYATHALVRDAVQRRLPGAGAPVACTGTGATATLPAGADLCVAVGHTAATTQKLQGDLVSVTVVQRLRGVEAAAGFVPLFGQQLARGVGTVRATALGRLE